jgi:membrane peptidoglycan carboxypeptidase
LWIRKDLARIDSNLESAKRSPVPRRVVDAILAVEDPGFMSRSRFDTIRAVIRFLTGTYSLPADRASLTNQYVKWQVGPRRGLRGIGRELLINAFIDSRGHPDQIAQAYAQSVYLGTINHRAIYGVNTAANEYFGRAPDSLSISQLALLVASIRSPSRFSPNKHSPGATTWRREVLSRMRSAGVITEQEYGTAAQELASTQNVRSTARTGLASAPRMRRGGAISSYSPSST